MKHNKSDIVLYHGRTASSKHRLPMPMLALGSMLEGRYNYEIVDGNFFHDAEEQLAQVIERSGAGWFGLHSAYGRTVVAGNVPGAAAGAFGWPAVPAGG